MGGRRRHGPKNLTALSFLLIEHVEDVEADLARFYPHRHDQLDRFWKGRMSWRRLWVLVSRLPRDAATVIAALGPERAAWSTEVELLAKTVDELRVANWLYAAAHRGPGPEPPPPEMIPRPADQQEPTRGR